MKKRIKVNGIIIFLVVMVIVWFPHIFLRSRKTGFFEEAIEIIGIALILFGQIIRVSARGYKSEQSRSSRLLIQGGPYSLVRNPMYLGILMIGLGIVLVLFRWWMLSIFLLVFGLRYFVLMKKEEKKLEQTFSKEYADYKRKVPRLLPSITTLLEEDISEFMPLRLHWFKSEIGSILAVLLVVILVEAWVDIKSEGLAMYLEEAVMVLLIIALFMCLIIYLSMRTASLEKDVSNKSKTGL